MPSAPGSWPPLGYRVVVAEVLRKKEKKVLEEDPVEAALVNRILPNGKDRRGDDLGRVSPHVCTGAASQDPARHA